MTSSPPPRGVSQETTGIETRASERSLPPVETLELITHDTRRAIVLVLWNADGEPLEFSTLRHEAGVEESGRFNYHLQRLIGPCVRATEAGYELTTKGEQFVLALSSVPSVTDTERYDRAAAD